MLGLRHIWLHLVPNKGQSLIRDLGAVSLTAFRKFVAVVKEGCEVSTAWGAGCFHKSVPLCGIVLQYMYP